MTWKFSILEKRGGIFNKAKSETLDDKVVSAKAWVLGAFNLNFIL